MPPGRPRLLLLVPCDKHGDAPCPSPNGCKNRRERAGLPPTPSGTSGHQRGHPERRKADEVGATPAAPSKPSG